MKYLCGLLVLVIVGFALGNSCADAATASAAANDDSAPAPSIHTGDTWVDRLASGDKEFKVTSVTSDDVTYTQWENEEESDSQWNPTVYRSLSVAGETPVTYSRPLPIFPFPLVPGKTWADEVKWQIREPAVEGRVEVEGKLGGWEDITVPAGTFRAIKGEVTTRAIGRGGARDIANIAYWYAPKVNRFVKYHYQSQAEGNVIDAELVSYKPAKQ